jgi:hypothetical protein
VNDPFQEHITAVERQLDVTRFRIEQARRAASDEDQMLEWLTVCATREAAAGEVEGTVVPSAWPRVRFGLTATENRVLWVLIAHEVCARSRAALRELETEQQPDVSLDVLRRVVYGPLPDARAWRDLSATGTLRSRCLIELIDGASRAPAHRQTFRVAPRVLALVSGHVDLDDDLVSLANLVDGDAGRVADLVIDEVASERVGERLATLHGLTIVCGLPGSGRRSLILRTAAGQARPLLLVECRWLPKATDELERVLRLLAREATLLQRLLVFLHLDELSGPAQLDVFESVVRPPAFATAKQPLARQWRRPPVQIELPRTTGTERALLWSRVLPGASKGDADLLAGMYPLAPALVHTVGHLATAKSGGAVRPEHVEAAVREILDDRLAAFGTRVSVTQTWDDVILPDEQTLAVVELLARIRQRRRVYEEWGFADKVGRGLGITALFSGPPGTGKTMCAGLVAKDLGTELYQVDVGRLASKWIGETEKNLGALFDAAEAGHAILLFDEADALFGKRTDVRSSNDRHANEQTNYLLQRIERFTGIAILTTNHETAIDEAFRRRLAVHVRFPVPDVDERERLWRAMLPTKAPIDDGIDFAALARKYVMSGGYIRNAVLRAAFLAADANESIGAYHLTHAALLEYEAMGKLATST